ncbi:dUTP diphosphatase [Acanthamoeba castellanii str. Neff]|uniref:dUTP diphosphatase n=1 Tax=Acanthamoeba castellanii (strain ATCC 30010 / Neff) TaxID=1257118 RepID=L8H9B7_ACACF|nr:dUTP diphosphatase [Acanthamoeba castellanii str. Neff]ELR21842.1 dUTP diphosphatase [Acanthamoeba castellanii str. Neff]
MQNQPLRIKLLVEGATTPRRAHSTDAGYDLFSAIDIVVLAQGWQLVDLRITIAGIDIGASVINGGYHGGVKALIFNHNNEDFIIALGDCVTQLILECIMTPKVEIMSNLDTTNHSKNRFSSTGVSKRLQVEA